MPNFKVKAVYEYSSPHDDDLNFPTGQIITVTELEGDDWYVGEYIDETGTKHDGLFPKNFVEKYEPEPPPRPNRMSRHKPLEQPQAAEAPPTPQIPQQEPAPVEHEEVETHKPQPPPVEVPSAPKSHLSPTSPTSASSDKPRDIPQEPPAAPKPEPAQPAAPPAKKVPPPVATKSSSFRDRIAAFNQSQAPPVAPFKPGGGPPSSFIKKPFVAPPPSRNAYVPPPPREQPQIKTYRREEDPEIAERQAQDQENADKAGLSGQGAAGNEDEEEQPKQISLKERIALLQKQQAEQAQRAAAAMHKEKPKKPPVKKRSEGQERAHEGEGEALEHVTSNDSHPRASQDHPRPRASHDLKSPDVTHQHREPFSDANDADQSGAGETEDAEGTSTSVEDDDERHRHHAAPERAPAAPSQEPDVGDEDGAEDDEEGEEEEDEMDEETRRKLELRERMAKMSGGMGMPGMFGGGLPMGALPPKKKQSKKSTGDSEEYAMPQQRVPMFAMPGMPVKSPEPVEDRHFSVEKDDEDSPRAPYDHPADEVPDVEDVTHKPPQRTPTGEHPPPIPSQERPVPQRLPTSDRPAPPPIPAASRPVPPIRSPSPGSESGDELTDVQAPTSPRTPSALPGSKRNSYLGSEEMSPSSPEHRAPPVPVASPPMSPSASRPPPPPPPTGAHPSRQPTLDSILQKANKVDRMEGESEYEGDYDTDIASGATHKDALKSHVRQPSLDGSTTADDTRSPTSPGGPPPLPPVHRAVPPPPPPQRASVDTPRGAPPPPPVPPPTRDYQDDEEDEDYDPYRYVPPPSAPPPAPRAVPPPPQHNVPPPPQSRPPPPAAPPLPPMIPPMPQYQKETQEADESSEEDDLYSAPPPRKSHDRPPPPPPQAPPHHPLPHRPQPRKSLDVNQVFQGRNSNDQPRASHSQEFIANEVDVGASSHWWTQQNMAPPSLQGRKDILLDMSETRSGSLIEKVVCALYMDYSQTVITARFDTNNVSDVQLEQRQEPPPPRLRQDQLEAAHERFGLRIAKDIESKANTIIGDGTPHGLVAELLRPYSKDVLQPVSTRSFGALVYSNLANASTQQYDEIRPGDIISFRNAKFAGKHGAMHAKYAMDVGKPDHCGVVSEWDGSKKKVRVWEQGRESRKTKVEGFRMGDLRSGEVRVWRVMGRGWVGWA